MQITVYDENRRPETPDLRTLDAFDASFCTEHYVFHFRSGSCAAREIEQIAAEQERCFRTIEETLRIPFTHQIQYFLADSPEENGRILEELFGMYAPGNGFAVGPNNVFAVCNDQIKCIGAHEDTHLISYAFCDPACEFLSEGLAMLMDGQWWGEPNAEWVKRFWQDGRYCSVLALADDETFEHTPCEITYPIAGAFTAFLTERLGVPAYLEQIYKPKQPLKEKLEHAFGMPPEAVERAFSDWIGESK